MSAPVTTWTRSLNRRRKALYLSSPIGLGHVRRDLAVGVEYRMKPDALAFAGSAFREHDWKDVFIAWAPSPHLSLTLAWVDLGNVVGHARQRGAYASVQLAF